PKTFFSSSLSCGFVKLEVCSGREIGAGFPGIFNGRAKVIMGSVMVCCSRKVVVGYAGIHSSRR
ncbi:MAG TPA: hypothetical protein GXX38_02450, partial [Clostridia bacterium]|nr:hypothetical protein [Clostridia bacterium]